MAKKKSKSLVGWTIKGWIKRFYDYEVFDFGEKDDFCDGVKLVKVKITQEGKKITIEEAEDEKEKE